ncbi:Coproporphyrinogen oxidase [Mycena indigotica]|uniref:coproporphyrinogen oxidase n=1 Tax=Mycena indigotica TaxID=2126181 RepID=A0A8H6W4G5_9AGAR|nr:Coproporphyrinogen oxidase [Mycena indigotica]KAF7298929.1 Coproporphyrinogen oxidase [Mycena indigotica]
MTLMRQQMEEYVFALQSRIVAGLEALDPGCPHKFVHDAWTRSQGGSGKSCVFAVPPDSEEGPEAVLEKAGVNVSVIHGVLPPAAVAQMSANHAALPAVPKDSPGLPFFVAGISLVIHPRSPHAPTVHANYRYFEVTDDAGAVLAWWFGGGSDLTPSYLYEEDAVHFHKTIKGVCDRYSSALYPALKAWCDEYFYIPHRGEARGVGGIFFDDLKHSPHPRIPGDDLSKRPATPEAIFALVTALGDAFLPSYLPILARRMHTPHTPLQRRWQLVRRGRYVEFNLVVDRGTKFGLTAPGARIESILMTLPETVRWEYMTDMGGEGTEEGRIMAVVTGKPREWV